MSMFHSKPIETVPTPQPDVAPPVELIALSVLQLDLSTPGEGWPAFLAARGISITIDDIGRASVARSDARLLFAERWNRRRSSRIGCAGHSWGRVSLPVRFLPV